MNASDCNATPDPFHEYLNPLPAPELEPTGPKPLKVEPVQRAEVTMEPELVLPSEDDESESPIVETAEVEMAVAERSRGPRWKFWRRPSKRDRQLDTLRQGASEMVGLMRSIRDHLESERGDREGLCKTLTPLPVAVETLQNMSNHQADAGRVLGELRTTLDRRTDHDQVLIDSLEQLGHTMSNVGETFSQMDRTLVGIDRSNQRTVATIQMLGDRVEGSDRFMNETFARLRDAEREFTDHMTRSARRSSFGMAALCSILVLSILAVGFMFKENRELLGAVQKSGALVVQVPQRSDLSEVTLFEELKQVDDGIGEPDREIVRAGAEDRKPADEKIVPVNTSSGTLLSVNKLPPRE